MAPSGPEKRDDVRSAQASRPHKHAPPAYVAKVVADEEICHFVQAYGGGDRAVAWIVAQQRGLITAAQFQLAGIGRGAIEARRLESRIHRMYRGVYLVGNPLQLDGARELGAVLACGRGVFLSHRSAAEMWGLLPGTIAAVTVTVVGRHCRSRPDIIVYRASRLARSDRATSHGLPITAPARTLIDLAVGAPDYELDHAIGEARLQALVNDHELQAALQRAGRRAGVGRLRTALESEDESDYTPSAAERRMRRLVKQARLPGPVYRAVVEGWPVDFFWPEQRLIVEVDGYKFHGHRGAFERDRRKDAMLVAAGLRVIRITWRQLTQEPMAVAAVVAGALAASRHTI